MKNFRQSTVLWLILLAAWAFLAADIYACLHMELPGMWRTLCFGVLVCLGALLLLTSLYIFPLVSRYDRPVPIILKHSFIMAVGNLHVSVTVLVVYIAAAAPHLVYFPFYFPYLRPWELLSAPICSAMCFPRYWQDQ